MNSIPPNTVGAYMNPHEYDQVVSKMRSFFHNRGLVEAHPQSLTSILAACEDPTTLTTFSYNGKTFPLPQTGQMWLEHYMLKYPSKYPQGLFCVSTSYRNEPNPVPGRHDKIFPMFEFEIPGTMEKMMDMEQDLCSYLGFTKPETGYTRKAYMDVVTEYSAPNNELEHEHEERLYNDYGDVVFLTDFPEWTSPFWNMRRHDDYDESKLSKKVDVIICGQETIGSAERSIDPNDMRERFMTISNGEYANTLFSHLNRNDVMAEMEFFLASDFFPRSGGGIGMTRMIRAMKTAGLL